MEPTARERDIRRAAELLRFGLKKAGLQEPQWIAAAIAEQFPRDDRPVVELCRWIRAMPEGTKDHVLYDGRDRKSRELANWWDEQKAADAVREAKEAEAARLASVREEAIARLTPEERKTLGVS